MTQPANHIADPSPRKRSASGFHNKTPAVAPKARSHKKRPVKLKEPQGVVDEVIIACMAQNRVATLLGFILGGFVPLASYFIAHKELALIEKLTPWNSAPLLMVLGGLLYSALTVFEWGSKAFEHKGKALGFVLLIELTLTLCHIDWLAIVALSLLVSINGISTGTKLALKRSIF